MGDVLFKIHRSYRWVVAICDKDLFGRKLKEDGRALDLSGQFFDGGEIGLDELREKIDDCVREDATFNIVGEKSVGVAKELGIVKAEGVMDIEGVPFALVLL